MESGGSKTEKWAKLLVSSFSASPIIHSVETKFFFWRIGMTMWAGCQTLHHHRLNHKEAHACTTQPSQIRDLEGSLERGQKLGICFALFYPFLLFQKHPGSGPR